MIDVVNLTQELIRFQSITPKQEGCLDYIATVLEGLGFTCTRLPFAEVDNLYARRGQTGPNFCFAGHVDVVPVDPIDQWQYPPFAGHIDNGTLYGRGVVDMKGAIAAFIAAVSAVGNQCQGSLSLLLTSDEEGPAEHGTVKVIEWLQAQGEAINACLVGEPTNPSYVGEMVKVGRRGSLNATVTVNGIAGHVAYPENSDNPIPRLLALLNEATTHSFDNGYEHFDPTHLEVTTIDVGNPTTNVIPAQATAKINIRFNPNHNAASLTTWLETVCGRYGAHLKIKVSGEAFLCQNASLKRALTEAITAVCGKEPKISTSGGTSDARFLKDICPVIEFGLVSKTAHHVDEHIAVEEIRLLQKVYEAVLLQLLPS